MSDYLRDAWKKAVEEMAQRLQADALAMRPVLVDDLHAYVDPNCKPYAAFQEFGRMELGTVVVDSTAVVIDENVQALPMPDSMQSEGEQ